MFIVFCVSMLAETNRHPFDLPEAEAELVSGYNVEYSAMTFALFFLGEYANMLLMSAFASVLFLGGWLPIINVFPLGSFPGSL
jgi:NADH-quinone oxidoreductase subunit H